MTPYLLKKSYKVKFLDVFRTFFTIPLFEKLLLKRILHSSTQFWNKFIPPNYLYKTGNFRNATRQGIKYKLDISNVIDHFVYWAGEDPGYVSILEEIKKAKVILDIGANIGSTALYFASINPVAQIFAFEPDQQNYKRAMENVELNNFQNINLINIGLGEKNETRKLYEVNAKNPGMNRLTVTGEDLSFKEVNINKLDDFCLERKISELDFIKIDVEGFEYFVLTGGSGAIKNSKPLLFIELDDGYLKDNNKSAKDLINLLISFGYKKIYRADNLNSIVTTLDFTNCHYDIIAKAE